MDNSWPPRAVPPAAIISPATIENSPNTVDAALHALDTRPAGLLEQQQFLSTVLHRMHSESESLRRAEATRTVPLAIRDPIEPADDWRSRADGTDSRGPARPYAEIDDVTEAVGNELD